MQEGMYSVCFCVCVCTLTNVVCGYILLIVSIFTSFSSCVGIFHLDNSYTEAIRMVC